MPSVAKQDSFVEVVPFLLTAPLVKMPGCPSIEKMRALLTFLEDDDTGGSSIREKKKRTIKGKKYIRV